MAVQPLLRRGEARKRKFFALLSEREARARVVEREKINENEEGNEKKGNDEEENQKQMMQRMFCSGAAWPTLS